MRMHVWAIVFGAAGTLGLAAACHDDGTAGAGGCVASCQDAISQGGVPCPLVAQAVTDYDALYACAGAAADAGFVAPGSGSSGGDDGGGGAPPALPVCTSLLAHGPLDPDCILAIEALPSPCSTSYTTCYGD
jgi:hypothetical protein